MTKEKLEDLKLGDTVRVHYERNGNVVDRVGFVQFNTEKEIWLLSCRESINHLKEGSIIKAIYNSIKYSIEEPENRHIRIPYNSISDVKVLEKNNSK